VLAAAIHVLASAPLKARVEERAREHARVTRPATDAAVASVPQKSLLEERLAAFADTLAEKRDLAAMVATVFEQAEKHSLVLAQAEYKLEFDKSGGFYAYQMRLPIRGPYPRLRGFVDGTLARIPCAALASIDFKRDAISATEAEARLRFVFYIRDAQT
jgi:hypothetical protein